MKVIHLDEREAQRVLEACEVAQSMLAAAENLTGRDGLDLTGHKLRSGIRLLREELELPSVPESVA